MTARGSRKSKSSASEAASDAWQRAVRFLTVRDHSEQEIRNRLAADGTAASAINATVRRLRQLRYLDDRRVAHGAAESAVRRGHGSERVRAELAAKGIAESLVEDALQAAFADEAELARQALARRYPVPPQQPGDRGRAARFLLRQGFPEAVVRSVLGEEFD